MRLSHYFRNCQLHVSHVIVASITTNTAFDTHSTTTSAATALTTTNTANTNNKPPAYRSSQASPASYTPYSLSIIHNPSSADTPQSTDIP
eukprot:610620-Pleurochrysis_carterae.AAC.2